MAKILLDKATSTGAGDAFQVGRKDTAGLNVDITGTAEVMLQVENEVSGAWVPVFDTNITSSKLATFGLPDGTYRANVVNYTSGEVSAVLHIG